MKIFQWWNLDHVSFNYHEDGDLTVVAPDLETARKMIRENKNVPDNCDALEKDPDRVWLLGQLTNPEVIPHPDAGCC